MSIVTGTYTKYQTEGIREDLSDVIYNISPEETPLISSIGREGASQTLFEWQTDELAAVDTGNKHIEGDDVTSFPALSPTVRVGNYTQISRKLAIISGTNEEADKAGRGSEMAYQIAKKGVELRRDMEAIVFENLGGDAGGDATERQTATLGAWVKTNTIFSSDGAPAGADPVYTSGVPSAARTDDSTLEALTETQFKNMCQLVWASGGTLKDVYAGPVNKQGISAFGGIATHTVQLNDSQRSPTVAVAAIDVYVSDFGNVRIMPSRWQRERDVWFIDPEYLQLRVFRGMRTEPLAKTGDADKRMILTEWGLQVKQEAALGLIADRTTS